MNFENNLAYPNQTIPNDLQTNLLIKKHKMKKLIYIFTFLFAFVFISNAAWSQVTVTGSTGADGVYTTLTDVGGAFAAINGSGQTGNNVVISITGDALAETGAVTLNASDWTTLIISPSGGAARTISGTFAGALIDLNGADNVTIDGLNAGGNSLTIANLSTGSASTIRLIDDATNNSITNCSVQGSSSTNNFGVIMLTSGTATGNDGNSITNCDIGPAGANSPNNGIFSSGSSSSIDNSGNTVNNCNIHDIFAAALSTTGIYVSSNNSNWTITNNRIYQTSTKTYTSGQTHQGIYVNSGEANDISNNVIGFANAGGTGTTNMIGLTSGSLGGTFPGSYTASGTANATRFVAIRGNFTNGGAASSIQGNTVAGFALYTSSNSSFAPGIFCGIYLTSGSVNVGTITGNTIGSTSGNGAIYTATTSSGGAIFGISVSSSSGNTANIHNNNIGGLDAMGSSSSNSGGIVGIYTTSSGDFDLSNNTIGNSVNPNLRMGNLTLAGNLSNVGDTFGASAGVGAFRGIYSQANGGTCNVGVTTPNLIRNASLNTTSNSTSSVLRGIEHTGFQELMNISNNSITNLTSASSGVGISSAGLTGIGILFSNQSTGSFITGNIISGLSLTNTGTAGTNLAGIALHNANSITVDKNIIYDLSNASTSASTTTPGTVSGIFIRSGNADMNIWNNMITLGYLNVENTCFVGIWGNHGQTSNPDVTNIFYNSVYITGVASSGAQPSFGYLRGDLSGTERTVSVDIKNNILNNDRTGGTGSHYAISNNYGATASSTGWIPDASNNNILNSANASTVGYWNADNTLATWKAASSSDGVSLTAIPMTFVAIPTGDLHLNMGLTPTQIESGGTVVAGVSTDIDNQTRPGPAGSVNGGATSPDIGADEIDGVPLDLTPPAISYTLLLNSSCYTTQNLSAVIITDGTGVNTTPGTNPRIWYRKTSNANALPGTNDNTTDGWKYTEALNASSPFNFTMDYSLLFGGVGSGDVIEYFVVAQDLAGTPNVGIFAGTFSSTPADVSLGIGAFPISGSNSYNLTTGLSGVVTIGAAGTYTSITEAGGLFEAINNNGLNGNLVAEILDASITENGTVSLNEITYGCTPGDHLTIKPASGVTTVLSGSNTTSIMNLNNADYVTFDGSNNGSSSKDMTIRNTGTGATVLFINGSNNDTVRSCIVESQNISSNSGTIIFGTSTGSTGNGNNVITGCDIRDRSDAAGMPANGIYSEGTPGLENGNVKVSGCNVFNFTNSGILVSATGAGDGWVINPSSFYHTSAGSTTLRYISILGGNGHTVKDNFIGGSAPNAGGSFFTLDNIFSGIYMSVGNTSTSTIEGNTVKNIRVTSLAQNGSSGIYVNSGRVDILGNTVGSSDTSESVVVGKSSLIITNRSSTGDMVVNNNIIENVHQFDTDNSSSVGSIYFFYLESTNSGSLELKDNTVKNVTNAGAHYNNRFFGGNSQTFGYFIFVNGVNTITGNTVLNMGNVNTNLLFGLYRNVITGMSLIKSLPGTVVNNNTFTGLYGSSPSTDANSDYIIGFSNGQNSKATVYNNTISIDGGADASDRLIEGISEQAGSTGEINYYYNSVQIYGTSNGANNTYAFNRIQFYRTILDLRNNVFSNSRVASTGSNIALSNEVTSPNTAQGWSADASNYNALYSLVDSTMTNWGGTISDLSTFQASSGGDLFTVVGNPGYTSNTNLLPDGSDPNSWTVKGNGIAISTIGVDKSGNPRSTSVMDGGTDIGAFEFSSSVMPPVYNNATAAAGIYKFIHAQDTMATINVTTLGTLSDINVQYYSGEDPPGLPHPSVLNGFGNVYWEIYPTSPADVNFDYDVTLHYSPALIGTISSESNIKVAKNNGVDTIYVPFIVQGTGPGQYQLDVVNHNITVYGLTGFSRFILTDGDIPLPVELSSFTSSINRRDVNLNWTTASETNNSGFDVERKVVISGEQDVWKKIGNVEGKGTSNTSFDYNFTDKNLASGKYEYRLKQIDFNGNYEYFNLSNEINIGVPDKFDLSQNYPNPFNPTTNINFDIPVDGKVSIILYDITGKEVSKLVNEVKTAGYYTINFNGSNLSSGMYFYRIVAEGNGQNFTTTKKMMLVK